MLALDYGAFRWYFFLMLSELVSVSKSVSTEPNHGILVSNFMLPINSLSSVPLFPSTYLYPPKKPRKCAELNIDYPDLRE